MNLASVHLVHTERDGYWALSSPRWPQLSMRRAENERPIPLRDVATHVSGLGVSAGIVHLHEEHEVPDATGDRYVIRWQVVDFYSKYEVTHRLSQALIEARFTEDLKKSQPRRGDGSRLLVIVEPHDPIGWVIDQLASDEDATLCVRSRSDELVLIPWGRVGPTSANVRSSAAQRGVGRDNTVGGLEAAIHANGYGHLVRGISTPCSNHAWNVWTTNLFVPKGREFEVEAVLRRPDSHAT